MPGVPAHLKTEKCANCKDPITEDQFIASLGFCHICFDIYQDLNLDEAETPTSKKRLDDDLKDEGFSPRDEWDSPLDYNDLDGDYE